MNEYANEYMNRLWSFCALENWSRNIFMRKLVNKKVLSTKKQHNPPEGERCIFDHFEDIIQIDRIHVPIGQHLTPEGHIRNKTLVRQQIIIIKNNN